MKPFSRNENTIHQTSSQRIQQSVDSNVKLSGAPPNLPGQDNFSYPCAGCDRVITHNCKEYRGCQLFMLWKLMAVFE
jgi:hypothetical protein